jgi:hypothetical protein
MAPDLLLKLLLSFEPDPQFVVSSGGCKRFLDLRIVFVTGSSPVSQ